MAGLHGANPSNSPARLVMCEAVPTTMHLGCFRGVLFGSRVVCGRARGSYLCYLLFTLKTHQAATEPLAEGAEPETPALSLSAALFALTGITVVVAVCSECAAPAGPTPRAACRRLCLAARPACLRSPVWQLMSQEWPDTCSHTSHCSAAHASPLCCTACDRFRMRTAAVLAALCGQVP